MHKLLPTSRLLAVAFAVALAGGLLLVVGAGAQSPSGDAAPASPAAVPAEIAALRLNEFMASNKTGLEDPDEPGSFPDWIELYNPGSDPVNIKGVAFSDDVANPARSPITVDVTIPAKGFLVFFADDDAKQGAKHLKFKLGADGEPLGLYWAATGEVIDFYEYGPQDADVSEGRKPDGTGSWQKFASPTPGRSNQLDPPVISDLQRNLQQPQSGEQVEVSAKVTDNKPGLQVNLAYSTTGASLQVVPMTPLGNDLYRAVIPAHGNGVHVAYTVRALDSDANAVESRRDGYVVGYVKPVIFINEFVAENRYIEGSPFNVPDEDDPGPPPQGEYPDWLELYNPGDTAVSMNGLSLTDNNSNPTKYRIPNGVSIPAKGYVIFWLDDDPEQGPRHTNFSLNKDGETIALWGAEGTVVIDSVTFGKQNDNVAMGRFPDGGAMQILDVPTPRKANVRLELKAYLPAGRR